MKIRTGKSDITFKQRASVTGTAVGNLYHTFGYRTATPFLDRLSDAARRIAGEEFFIFPHSIIDGDSVILHGKYKETRKQPHAVSVVVGIKSNINAIKDALVSAQNKLMLSKSN